MKTLKIDEQNARRLFPKANDEFKTMLIDSFGADFFKEKITDRIKTYMDACEVLGMNPKGSNTLTAPDFTMGDGHSIEAYSKLIIIARALNEGWKPDWKDRSQPKYVPYFEMHRPGVGVAFDGCVGWCTFSFVGSRLCFKSRELAEYAAKQFHAEYKAFFIEE